MRLTDLYLFECCGERLYALSIDYAGCNLPRAACREGWVLRKHLKPAELIEEDAPAIDATAQHGFLVLEKVPQGWLE